MEDSIPIAGSSKHKPAKLRRSTKRKAAKQQLLEAPVDGNVAGPSKIKVDRAPKISKRKAEKRPETSSAEQAWEGQEWESVPLAEAGVSKVPPIWSRDGRFYFSVSGTSIHIHSATPPTYNLLSTLSSNSRHGHKKPITALYLSPSNSLQLISSSDDGTVKIWDWVEGRLVRTVTFTESARGRVRHIAISNVNSKWWIFAVVTEPKDAATGKGKEKSDPQMAHRIYRVALSQPAGSVPAPPFYIGKLSNPSSALLISPRSTYLVALSANKAYTFKLPLSTADDSWRPPCVKFVSDQTFTCGAFAPSRSLGGTDEEEWFATGDTKGNIRLWHGLAAAFRQLEVAGDGNPKQAFGDTEKRLPTTSLHWHAHAVGALAFAPSGAQLLSVGEESVLVQWYLASGKREYVPRLGGKPIISLGVKEGGKGVEEEWWMRMADGGVVRVGAASGSVKTVGQAVRLDPLRPKSNIPYPLLQHPTTKAIVLPSSHPSTLQFLEASTSAVLYDLEVAPSNRVSRRDERELEPIAVERVAFSGDGRWMASIEGRDGDEAEGGGGVKTLKIWQFGGNTKWSINTQLPRPHDSADITSISFATPPASISSSPIPANNPASAPYLLTTGDDGTVKLWQARAAKKSDHGKAAKKSASTEIFWSLRTSFEYRGMPVYDSAFSPDATMIALAHGTTVTLWDVETNQLLRALDVGADVEFRRLAFIGAEGRHLVATGQKKGLVVWDLLACEVVWTSIMETTGALITVPSSPFFTLTYQADSSTTIFSVFNPTSPTPTRQIRISQRFNHICQLLTPSTPSPEQIQFIGLTRNGEILRFGDQVSAEITSVKSINQDQMKGSSIWQEMFGKDAFLEVEDVEEQVQVDRVLPVRRGGKPSEVFDGPSHTLPPVGLLFDSFMEDILVPRESKKVEGVVNGGILYDKDTIMEVEEVGGRGVAKVKAVTDDDMRDLESFFREVLSSKTADPVTPAKIGKVNGNGHTVKSPPSAIREAEIGVREASVAEAGIDGGKINEAVSAEVTEGAITESAGKKSRSKKRKAVKE